MSAGTAPVYPGCPDPTKPCAPRSNVKNPSKSEFEWIGFAFSCLPAGVGIANVIYKWSINPFLAIWILVWSSIALMVLIFVRRDSFDPTSGSKGIISIFMYSCIGLTLATIAGTQFYYRKNFKPGTFTRALVSEIAADSEGYPTISGMNGN